MKLLPWQYNNFQKYSQWHHMIIKLTDLTQYSCLQFLSTPLLEYLNKRCYSIASANSLKIHLYKSYVALSTTIQYSAVRNKQNEVSLSEMRIMTHLFLAAAALSLCRLFLNQLPTCVGVRPVALANSRFLAGLG